MRAQTAAGGALCIGQVALTVPYTAPQVVNLKYMKKSVRDEARAQYKQQAKANKRTKLDPDLAKGTLALQREAAAAAAQQKVQNGGEGGGSDSDAGSDGDDADGEEGSSGSEGEEGVAPRRRQQSAAAAQQQGAPGGAAGGVLGQLAISKGRPPSRDELKERLQKKLEVRPLAGRLDGLWGGVVMLAGCHLMCVAKMRLSPGGCSLCGAR